MKNICALAGLLLVLTHVQAGINKWVDAEGRVHYGDRPPATASAASMRGTVSVGDGVTALPDSDKEAPPAQTAAVTPRKGEVWIYTTPTCGYCRYAKEHMRLKNVRFLEKDITANAKYKSEFRALGGRGVPVTVSGSQRINGYKESAFDVFLKSAGF